MKKVFHSMIRKNWLGKTGVQDIFALLQYVYESMFDQISLTWE